MKKCLAVFVSLLSIGVFSQETSEPKALYIKGNALLAPVLITNIGIEKELSEKFTLQVDGLISPWKSFAGNHFQIYMGHVEGRYYFDKAFDGWFVGLNAGFGLFDLTKWNYRGTEKFQRGFNFMFGGSVGYQWELSEKWNMEAFLGGGTSQGLYHGYEEIPPDRWIRYDGAKDWNKSGEWLPYRGGIMISYKIK